MDLTLELESGDINYNEIGSPLSPITQDIPPPSPRYNLFNKMKYFFLIIYHYLRIKIC